MDARAMTNSGRNGGMDAARGRTRRPKRSALYAAAKKKPVRPAAGRQ